MTFHQVDDFDVLVRSEIGVLEPDPDRCPQQDAREIDLVLVPGLAFTKSGQRLGRGGGYYDRFLANLSPEVETLGIALPCQIFETLPTEPHDIPVRRVLLTPDP
jgi:5-formyltetrahydrofolate cyclo-ligase